MRCSAKAVLEPARGIVIGFRGLGQNIFTLISEVAKVWLQRDIQECIVGLDFMCLSTMACSTAGTIQV